MCERSCDSTPGVAASAPTVASSRLCQSRLSRSKMSPNRWDCRNWLITGANSNTGPLTGAPEISV
ncbi:hypothetical protein KPSA3_06046 [Pseudomonas syringae pv. actinidiae]|uniref:Uncharacterized protein n=1 Tax=Pseudomonas syringae pv. actinidiae TaxID=103796 RepID=A0AAN4TP82_PSESF|nr:hypothetical protein KPSA3_06046 [Pseudomonas syringae pv. actinidiae]